MSLVITGSPGVGKHTIGTLVSQMYNKKILDLNQIAVQNGFSEKVKETLDVDTEKLTVFLKDVKDEIIIGHLAPYALTREQVQHAIILRKSPYSLSEIYQKRGYSKEKTRENIQSEILGITAHDAIKSFGDSKVRQIDVTQKTTQETVQQISDILKQDTVGDYVDWLGQITDRGDLQKFFSYD